MAHWTTVEIAVFYMFMQKTGKKAAVLTPDWTKQSVPRTRSASGKVRSPRDNCRVGWMMSMEVAVRQHMAETVSVLKLLTNEACGAVVLCDRTAAASWRKPAKQRH